MTADQKKCGRQRLMTPGEELLMVPSRLRCGFLQEDLAHRLAYHVHMFHEFGLLSWHFSTSDSVHCLFGPQECSLMKICLWVKQNFPHTREIIDCIEIMIEIPSSCRSQSTTFTCNTAKAFLVFPRMATLVLFQALMLAGQVIKNHKRLWILNLLEVEDHIMADRGFDIGEDLFPGVTLNISPSLNGKNQLSLEQEVTTRKIASVRVQVLEFYTRSYQ